MSITAPSKYLFIAAGTYALVCAPAILLMEHLGWSQAFFHITQFFATILCLPAASAFLWSTRGMRFDWARCLAVVASVLSGLWLAFVGYVLLTFDLSGM